MLVFLHFGNCEKATDAGHTEDVGHVDGFFGSEVILAQGGERGIGFFPGVHVVADEQEAGVRWVEGEGVIVLIFGLEGLDGLALFVGGGEGRYHGENHGGHGNTKFAEEI